MRVIDFGAGDPAWTTIDDVVMGGVSSSQMRVENGCGVFQGTVSLDNNGGFASARSPDTPIDLSAARGVRIKVRGDGRVYSFRIRTAQTAEGVSYRHKFAAPKDEWREIDLLFDAFKPVFRGRVLDDFPTLAPAEIRGFGLLIADKQDGDFKLEMAWIEGLI